jgi:exodeoxyribonuclease VII large subunit
MDSPVITLADLSTIVQSVVRETFTGMVWVEATVSTFSQPAGGHWYLTLVDEGVSMRAACWRNVNMRLTKPTVGAVIRMYGRIDFYRNRGEIQFIIEQILDVGESMAQAELRRLVAQYQPMSKRRPLPAYPRRIGLVTSQTGAAVSDVIKTIQLRYPACELWAAYSTVQGELAPAAVAEALELLYAEPVDVILLVRGGGSAEDLAAFNSELIAQTILRSPVPLVTGIGHEPDVTLADFVADVRAATPTAAAERATPNIQDLQTHVNTQQRAMDIAMAMYCTNREMHLDDLDNRLRLAAPAQRIEMQRKQVEFWRYQLDQHLDTTMQRLQQRLGQAHYALEALAPQHVLQRGYVLVRDEQQQLITRAGAVQAHQRLTLQFHDGNVVVQHEESTS